MRSDSRRFLISAATWRVTSSRRRSSSSRIRCADAARSFSSFARSRGESVAFLFELRPQRRASSLLPPAPRTFSSAARRAVIGLAVAVAEAVARAVDDRRGEADHLRDIDRAAAAGDAGDHAIRRLPGRGIELHRRIDDARVVDREALQRGEMRRHDQQRAGFEQMLDDCRRERRAFLGIRSRSQLVEQHERAIRGALEHALAGARGTRRRSRDVRARSGRRRSARGTRRRPE